MGACQTDDVGTNVPPRNIRIMMLVLVNFCQSFDFPPPHPVITHDDLFFPPIPFLDVHNVKIAKRVNAVYSDRSMGAHTAWRTSHNPPIRGPSTKK